MPSNVVKTKRDERLWTQAKKSAKAQYGGKIKEGSSRFWSIVNGIFQRMKRRIGGTKIKTAAAGPMNKSGYIKLARDVAQEFFNTGDDLNDIIVKVALVKNLNDHQIQNICSTTNHLIHAAIMNEKKAEADKYIDFDIARPEKVAKIINDLTEIADEIYDYPEKIFSVQPTKRTAQCSYGEFVKKTVKRGQVLKQNIKNIILAHSKVADALYAEVVNIEEKISRLYNLVRWAVENGKKPEIIKDVLQKVFDDSSNFSLVWEEIYARLVADNIIRRKVDDKDRQPAVLSVENWSPNPSAPIVVASVDVNRRLNKTEELEKTLSALEKMAQEAKSELTDALILEKQAVVGAAMRGVGSWVMKKLLKMVAKAAKPTAKIVAKKKGSLSGKLIGGTFIGMDAIPAMGKKNIRIMRLPK